MTDTGEKPLIGKDECARNIQAGYRRLYRIAEKYRRGMMDDEAFERLCSEVLFDCFFGFLRDKGLNRRFTYAAWPGFLRDLDRWIQGMEPVRTVDDAGAEPWLVTFLSPGEAGAAEREDSRHAFRREAAPEDKTAFFELMDAFGIPAEYFEPAPGDITDERIMGRMGGVYSPSVPWTVFSDWEDADGLLRETSPEGKSFTLISGYGLKACVSVTDWDQDEGGRTRYGGTGVIEGYTSGRMRRIGIEAYGGRIRAVSYEEEADDRTAHDAFPLWQDYLENCRKKDRIFHCILRRLGCRFSMMTGV